MSTSSSPVRRALTSEEKTFIVAILHRHFCLYAAELGGEEVIDELMDNRGKWQMGFDDGIYWAMPMTSYGLCVRSIAESNTFKWDERTFEAMKTVVAVAVIDDMQKAEGKYTT